MRARFSPASALTRFSDPFIRRMEGRHSGRSSVLSSAQPRKECWRLVWMGQQVEQQNPACAGTPAVANRNDGESCYNSFVDGPAGAAVKPGRSSLVVVSFYKFAELPDCVEMRAPLKKLCDAHRVSGGIILAPEGINGSICGTRESVDNVFTILQADARLKDLRRNEAPATQEEEDLHHGQTEKSPLGAGADAPFRWGHVRVKLKNEVVPLGIPGVKPSEKVGTYVKPKDWNALISDPKTVVIDVRNDYEIRIGKFKGALDPKTEAFREFPAWVENRFGLSTDVTPSQCPDEGVRGSNLDASGHDDQSTSSVFGDSQNYVPLQAQHPQIAMYCTGGIRCEKATSYLINKGFNEVYHLEGGILKYLEQVPPAESLWEGECFVFDKRVSVDHGLKQGIHSLCFSCKKPVNDDDKTSPLWEEGISCPYCFYGRSHEEKERARARQIQFQTTGVIGGLGNGKHKVQQQN